MSFLNAGNLVADSAKEKRPPTKVGLFQKGSSEGPSCIGRIPWRLLIMPPVEVVNDERNQIWFCMVLLEPNSEILKFLPPKATGTGVWTLQDVAGVLSWCLAMGTFAVVLLFAKLLHFAGTTMTGAVF